MALAGRIALAGRPDRGRYRQRPRQVVRADDHRRRRGLARGGRALPNAGRMRQGRDPAEQDPRPPQRVAEMSGVIKSGAAGFESRVRPFAFTSAIAVPPQLDPELVELRQRVLDLEAALAGRVEEVERLTLTSEDAFAEGEAAGRDTGRAEADTRRGEALDLLAKSTGRAVAALDTRLEAADRLAVSLAQTCLEH